MTNEEIKYELIYRVNNLLNYKSSKTEDLVEIQNRLNNLKLFMTKIQEILNDILSENKIKFNSEKERDDFIIFIKPTVNELSRKILYK